MNERIKELAEQATTKISFRLDPNTYKHIDDPEGDLERFEFDKQKFALLIVQECMKLNSKELSITAIERLLPLYAEHFGVEL